MVQRIIATCCLAWLVPTAIMAQTPAKTLDQLTKDVQELQRSLTAVSENLSIVAKQVADNTDAGTKNAQGVERLTTILNEELRKQQDILEQINEFAREQQLQLARQQEILDAITQRDSQGNDVLRLSANMDQSEEFREDMQKSVHRSLETHGQFTVENRMENEQQLLVNQKEYRLGAGEVLTLQVPVGTVTAQLPGQRLTNWTVTAPTYSQKIEIVPETQGATTVYRPAEGSGLPPAIPFSTEPVYLAPLPLYGTAPVRYYMLP
jgi:ABC-type transporter Mla subunit MlaD